MKDLVNGNANVLTVILSGVAAIAMTLGVILLTVILSMVSRNGERIDLLDFTIVQHEIQHPDHALRQQIAVQKACVTAQFEKVEARMDGFEERLVRVGEKLIAEISEEEG